MDEASALAPEPIIRLAISVLIGQVPSIEKPALITASKKVTHPVLVVLPSLVSAAGGAVGFGGRQRELARQRKESQGIMAQQEAAAKAARAALPEYSVGRAGRQAFMMSQQDRAGDIAQREIQRAQGAGLGALQA